MAEVGNIFPKNAPEQLIEMSKGLNATNDATNKLLETTRKLSALLKESNISFTKLSEAQKGAEKVSKELNTIETQIIKNSIKINELNTNRAKTIAAQKVAIQAKNKALKDGAKLEAANTKAIKENIIVAKAQNGAYNAITAALTKNVAKWKSLPKAIREGTKAGKELEAAILRDEKALKKLDSQIGRSQRHVGNYGQALKGVATNLLGAFGVIGGVAMFARVMRDAFSTLRSFTKENAVLAGVLGKTRKEITELTDQAIQLGSIYPVTASEVTKLQVSYARLGFTMAEISNLTEATILGSIALNAELDATATLVGAVVKAYSNLGTTDALWIIDQLTTATQKTSLSFSGLETGLPKVAAAANAMNIPLSQTLALLGTAHDATLDASIAGTSLRNIFLELDKTGLTLDEALNKINGSQNKLTEAYELFGKRAAIVALAIAQNKDKTKELTTEINTLKTAVKTADEQMKTLDGSIKGLDSSWEKAILKLRGSESFLKGFFDGISNKINAFTDEYATFTERLLLGSGVIGKIAAKYKEIVYGEENVIEVTEKRVKARHKFLTEIENMTGREAIHQININKAKADSGNKYSKAIIEAAKKRIKILIKLEDEQRIKDKNKRDNAELEKRVLEDEIAEMKKSAIEKEIEAVSEKYKNLIAKANKYGIDTIELEQMQADEIKQIRIDAETGANDEIKKQRDKYYKDLRTKNKQFVKGNEVEGKKEVKLENDILDNRIKSQDELEVDALERRNKERKEGKKTVEQVIREEKQKQSDTLELINLGAEAAGAIADTLTNNKIANLQKEFDILMLQKEAELADENLTAEEKQKIEEKYAKKAAEIKTKQAKAEKKAAIIDVAINTAVAVSKVWGQTGIFGIAAQIPVLIMGALQAGLIASQPIPEFAKGTMEAPSEFIAGEKGRELMQLKSGKVIMADKPTHFKGNEYKGATIKSNPETEKIMAQANSQGNVYFDTNDLRNEIKALHKTIKNKPAAIIQDGRVIGSQTNSHREIYLNKLKYGQ